MANPSGIERKGKRKGKSFLFFFLWKAENWNAESEKETEFFWAETGRDLVA